MTSSLPGPLLWVVVLDASQHLGAVESPDGEDPALEGDGGEVGADPRHVRQPVPQVRRCREEGSRLVTDQCSVQWAVCRVQC